MTNLMLDAVSLKHLPRAGWGRAGIEGAESVAAHAWGVGWLVILLADGGIDRAKALELALVHDLPEIRTGDITPHDGISRGRKMEMERTAAEQLFADQPRLLALWEEYAAGSSPEARFVKDCDKLDMAIQAVRYADETGADTQEFIESAKRAIQTNTVRRAFEGFIKKARR